MGKSVPKPVFFTSTPHHGLAGESRRLRVGFADGVVWKKIEFFDMADKKGEVQAGAEPELEFTNLAKGAHAFIAQVTDSADQVHLTHPVMVIMVP